MNQIKHVRSIACAILATATPGLAATADFTGQNGWGQFGGVYGGTVTTINATTSQHASGSASLVLDVADGSGLSCPVAQFTPKTGGTVTVSMNMYFPSTSQGAFLFGFDDGVGGYSNGWYVSDALGTWRDRWVAMKFVVDLNTPAPGNGTYYFDDMVTPAGTFDYGSDTINNAWFLVGNGFNGGTVTGPFYFDDMVVTQDSTVVWSDNFDSYISAGGDPNLISVDVVTGTSVAVSGDVTGSPFTGQSGLWNALAIDGNKISLNSLTNGAGTSASGVGFVFDSESVGYHPGGGSNYDPGVVLAADEPERSWMTGGETPVTFKFTGLTIGGNYSLAIYTTGDALMTLTVNGTPTLDPGKIFPATTTADSNGDIVCQVSCGGDPYANYGEIAGIQLLKLVAPPALAAHAGLDKALSPGTPSAVLGATPAATGGTPGYTYLWSPDTGLDDKTLEHPTVTTTAATTTYTLTVTDSLLATQTDTVLVTYGVPALVVSAGADKSVSPSSTSVAIGGSPSASGGSGSYTYSWSPTTGLDDPTAANPTASPTATTTYTLTVTDSLSASASDEVLVTYEAPPAGSPNLVSVDVVRTNSIAVSGDVTGSPFTGQSGLWNRLVGGDPPASLSNLTNGDGGTTLIGLTSAFTGRHGFQSSGSVSGVVLAANDPERLWVSTDGTLTLTFTGLNAGGSYNLAIYNTGSSQGVITINGGTPHTGVSTIFTSSEVADSLGKITTVVSFSGPIENSYMEISGLQIYSTGAPPSGYSTWASDHAGGANAPVDGDYNQDGVQNGIAYFMGMDGLATVPGVDNGSVTWPYLNGVASYKVQYSYDLSPTGWVDVAANDSHLHTTDPGPSGHVTYDLPTGVVGGKIFARLLVTP